MTTESIGRNFRYGCLRSLKGDDVAPMLEWMHDPDVAGMFQADFSSMDTDDALKFVEDSWTDTQSLHFAISGKNGEYLGTVSLKNVNKAHANAEYAISTRQCVHGTGAALEATLDVLNFAFDQLGLHRVYLNVRADNPRAIRFYEKVGFTREGITRDSLRLSDGAFIDLVWFAMLAGYSK